MTLVSKRRLRATPALRVTLTPSEQRLIRMLITACEQVAARIDMTALLHALQHGPTEAAVNAVDLSPFADIAGPWADELTTETLDAGSRTSMIVRKQSIIEIAFDRQRPEARQWARRNAANLITNIDADQRKAIRGWVADSMTGRYTVYEVQDMIHDTVGLTPQQTVWVRNFYDRTRARLSKLPAGRAQDLAVQRSGRYANRLLRSRAETIARTEVMRALSEGRRLAWRQQVDNGVLHPSTLKMWVSQRDGLVCDRCIEFDGMRVPVLTEFPSGDPPAHPNCRCSLILIPTSPVDQHGVADLSGMTDDELRDELQRLLQGDLPVLQKPAPEGDALWAMVAESEPPTVTGSRIIDAFRDIRGYTADPSTVNMNLFRDLLSNGQQVLYRLPVDDKLARTAVAGATYGRGEYLTSDRQRFMRWARDEFPNVRERAEQLENLRNVILHPQATTIEWEELYEQWLGARDEFESPIALAVARGYDAIMYRLKSGQIVYNVLNGAAIVKPR